MRVNISFRFIFDHAPALICYSDLPQVVGVPLCKEGILPKGNDVVDSVRRLRVCG